MKKLAINIDGIIRDYLSKFDSVYRKKFIHNSDEVGANIPTHTEYASGSSGQEDFTVREPSEEELEEIQEHIRQKEIELIKLPIESDRLTNHYKFDPIRIKMLKDSDVTSGLKNATGDVMLGSKEDINITPKEALDKFMYEDYAFQIFGKAGEYKNAMESLKRIAIFGKANNLFDVILFSTVKKKARASTYSFLGIFSCEINTLLFLDKEEDIWDHCDILIDHAPKALHNKPDDKVLIKINRDWNKYDDIEPNFDELSDLVKSKFLETLK